MSEVAIWTVFDAALESRYPYDNPFQDVAVQLTATAPSGKRHTVDAFWDGANIWRARLQASEVGAWHWQSGCSDIGNPGLHGQRGTFKCVPYVGDNALYRHGGVKLSSNGRFFIHADGTPFFWLGDTAWSGVLRSRFDDWIYYGQIRQQQRFTAVQFMGTHYRAVPQDAHGETGFTHGDPSHINPAFFQRLDSKVAAINAHGMLAVPILIHDNGERNLGHVLSEDQAIRLARYEVARWGAYHVAFILGGDGGYGGERLERWLRIGRGTFGHQAESLVTLLPAGLGWVADEFRREPWFTFVGYQSGHGSGDDDLRWLTAGPPATEWRRHRPVPFVNMELNYEAHPAFNDRHLFSDFEVRRAFYWSLLAAPTAGATFGHNSVWPWGEQAEEPAGHGNFFGIVPPWRVGLDTPGVQSVTVLRNLLDSLPWWQLRPAPELLETQPGARAPQRFVAAAQTDDGAHALVYIPQGDTVTVHTAALAHPVYARWFHPRLGTWSEAEAVVDRRQEFVCPDRDDWILYLAAHVGSC